MGYIWLILEQKKAFFALISITYTQKYKIRLFISVILEYMCNFGQNISFEAFCMFLTDSSLFFNWNDYLPLLYYPWACIDPFLISLAQFWPKNWNFVIFGHFERFPYLGSGIYAPTQNLSSLHQNINILCTSYQNCFLPGLGPFKGVLGQKLFF